MSEDYVPVYDEDGNLKHYQSTELTFERLEATSEFVDPGGTSHTGEVGGGGGNVQGVPDGSYVINTGTGAVMPGASGDNTTSASSKATNTEDLTSDFTVGPWITLTPDDVPDDCLLTLSYTNLDVNAKSFDVVVRNFSPTDPGLISYRWLAYGQID